MIAFVGVPTSVKKGPGKWDAPEVTFQVIENFGRLSIAKTETVVFGDGYSESAEPKLLLVDRRDDGRYGIQYCGSGMALSLKSAMAQTFLKYVADKAPATVSLFIKSRPGRVPIPGVRVQMIGNGRTYQGVTSSKAALSFQNVPPGDYELTYSRENFSPEQASRRLAVLPGACGSANFFLESVSEVSGRYLSARGEPLTAGRLLLRGAPKVLGGAPTLAWAMERLHQLLPGSRPEQDAYFDAEPAHDGTFRFTGVYPGWYRLAAVDLNKHRAPPFGEIYYPGVGTWSAADVIVVQEGQSVGQIDFRLPDRISVGPESTKRMRPLAAP